MKIHALALILIAVVTHTVWGDKEHIDMNCEAKCDAECKPESHCEFIAGVIPVLCEDVPKGCNSYCVERCQCKEDCQEYCAGEANEHACHASCARKVPACAPDIPEYAKEGATGAPNAPNENTTPKNDTDDLDIPDNFKLPPAGMGFPPPPPEILEEIEEEAEEDAQGSLVEKK
jgi:hypothetical protein